MIFSERKRHILYALENKGVISIKETSVLLDASEITIRRDFEKLENEGYLTRVNGGAILNDDSFENVELSMSRKKIQNAEKKERTALAASKYIKDGDCVFIDCGTCMIPLIKLLERKQITIVTNNLTILQYLKKPIAEVFVIGGRYNAIYQFNAGSSAEEYMNAFHFDHTILGCAGIDLASGDIYTSAMDGYIMKKASIDHSIHSILLLDSTKLSKKSLVKFSNIKEMNTIICDTSDANLNASFPKNFIFV